MDIVFQTLVINLTNFDVSANSGFLLSYISRARAFGSLNTPKSNRFLIYRFKNKSEQNLVMLDYTMKTVHTCKLAKDVKLKYTKY